MKTIFAVSAFGLALTLISTPSSLNAASKADENRGQLSEKDYKFACEAAKGGITEVKAGELAKTKASDPAVKEFGEKMVAEHGQAAEELKAIAAKKGATLPVELDTDQKRLINRLQNLTGEDFDKTYAKEMVDDHKKDLKEFQKAAEKVEDTDLRSFAAKTATLVAQHLQHAQTISAVVNKR